MLPKWLKRSSLALSLLLGAATWFVLTGVWLRAIKGGFIDTTVGALYEPAYNAGRYVGALIFPDYAVRGTTGWYLIPLFGAAGEFVLLTAIWYFCIRLTRVFQPQEPEPLPGVDKQSLKIPLRRADSFDGAHEPDYTPTWRSSYLPGLDSLLGTIDYERFKLRTWREFRDHTGRWPVLSICFHYATLIGTVVGVIVFLWIRDKQQWDNARSFAIGIPLGIFDLIVVVFGNNLVRRLDWRLFGCATRQSGSQRG